MYLIKGNTANEARITNSTRIAGCSKNLPANLGSNFNVTKFKESLLHKCIAKTGSIVRTTNLANEKKDFKLLFLLGN